MKPRRLKTIAVCAAQVPFVSGGAETLVQSLYSELRSRQYETEIINIPFKWYPHRQLLKSVEIWENLDLTEANGKKIDLVIATKFPSYFIHHPNKKIWLIHQYRQLYDLFDSPYSGFDHDSPRDMEIHRELVRKDTKQLKSFKKIFTISKNTSDRLRKYNGLDSAPLYPPPKLTGRYYHEGDRNYILSVGRLDELKRVDLLIRSLPHCDPKIRCKIVGTGHEEEKLRWEAQKARVEDRVDFMGFVSDEELLRLYAQCSFVFFTPRDEDLGYITLEAFLSRKAVVTTRDAGEPLEFVVNGETGVVSDSLDPKEIGPLLNDLFFDKEKAGRMGANGYEIVKKIGWNEVIDNLIG